MNARLAPAVLLSMVVVLVLSGFASASSIPQRMSADPRPSIRASPDPIEMGTFLSVSLDGPANASLRVWILYQGQSAVEIYNATLNANGTSSASFYVDCRIQEILNNTCAWQPGQYVAWVTDREDNILNRTTFDVRLNDAVLWRLFVGLMLQNQGQNQASIAAMWGVLGTSLGAIALVTGVVLLIIYIEVLAPVELGPRGVRFLLRMPRAFLRFWFKRTIPRNYNAAIFPDLGRRERARRNVQVYELIAKRHANRAERLEARASRCRRAEDFYTRGSKHWSEKVEEGAHGDT